MYGSEINDLYWALVGHLVSRYWTELITYFTNNENEILSHYVILQRNYYLYKTRMIP